MVAITKYLVQQLVLDSLRINVIFDGWDVLETLLGHVALRLVNRLAALIYFIIECDDDGLTYPIDRFPLNCTHRSGLRLTVSVLYVPSLRIACLLHNFIN